MEESRELAELGNLEDLIIPPRTLMGPGPVDVDPRVLSAMAQPLLSHLDPDFTRIMDEVMEMLRRVFMTNNRFTAAISATGHGGMEAALLNVVEPGETVIVGVCGLFGERLAEIAERIGARVVRVEGEWGKPVDPYDIKKAIDDNPGAKLVAVIHGETSTGVLQPLDDIIKVAHDRGVLVLVDTVVTLGGCEVNVDGWGLDICYSGSQKCISAPPGLAPLTISDRVADVIKGRRSKVRSWYFDLGKIFDYWGQERFYHHTAPISLVYALREALRLLLAEGLENSWKRHAQHGRALLLGLDAMDLHSPVDPAYRIPQLVVIKVPEHIDEARARKALVERCGIEIAGGLGQLKGQVWRIGLLGYSAQKKNVLTLLMALEQILREEGHRFEPGAGVEAALRVYAEKQ